MWRIEYKENEFKRIDLLNGVENITPFDSESERVANHLENPSSKTRINRIELERQFFCSVISPVSILINPRND